MTLLRRHTKWSSLRARLIREIWPLGMPLGVMPQVTEDYGGLSYATANPIDVARADLLEMTLPRGGAPTAFLYHPRRPINRCAIVHAGHGITHYDTGTRMDLMDRALLRSGFHVLGIDMPDYPSADYTLADGTPVTVASHDFSALEADGVHALRFFLEPVVVVLNYLSTLGFRSIDMTGISGGGWTTDHAAAVDRRIRYSAPVMGSLPHDLRPPGDLGDWEQFEARSWYAIASFVELYTLGCCELDRKRLQILGELDPAFPVNDAVDIRPDVNAYVAEINLAAAGQCAANFDATTALHEYSDQTIGQVIDFFRRAA